MVLNEISAAHEECLEDEARRNLEASALSKEIFIGIRNYRQLVDAYGFAEISRAVGVLLCRIKRWIGVKSVASLMGADRIRIAGRDRVISGSDPKVAGMRQRVESLLVDLVLEPIWIDGEPVHLDIALTDAGSGWLDLRFASNISPVAWAHDIDFARSSYRADMARVSPVLASLGGFHGADRGELSVDVCWRPICADRSPGSAVFFEASLGIIDANGQFTIADRVIEAAERIGLVHLIDQYLVTRVVDELIAAPGAVSLSVSVSGRCLANGGFWRSALDRLKMGGAVANDLIVEIRGGPVCDAGGGWAETIDRLKSAGCRTSLANFGLGATSLGDVASFAPDLVTVDKQFLSPAGQVRFSSAVLSHLVALAQALGAEVVIDGIDSFELASASQSLGASLFKGEWFGRPRIYRSWAHRSEDNQNYICAA